MTAPTELDERALESFTEYFVKNYPGPDTIIHDPKWHAPRIFRAARAAISSVAASGAGWRDMDSAPKDGTKIQVCADGYEWPEIIYYEKYDDETAAEVGEPGYWRYADDLFADVADIEFDTLTHWMPLPAAPDRRAGE